MARIIMELKPTALRTTTYEPRFSPKTFCWMAHAVSLMKRHTPEVMNMPGQKPTSSWSELTMTTPAKRYTGTPGTGGIRKRKMPKATVTPVTAPGPQLAVSSLSHASIRTTTLPTPTFMTKYRIPHSSVHTNTFVGLAKRNSAKPRPLLVRALTRGPPPSASCAAGRQHGSPRYFLTAWFAAERAKNTRTRGRQQKTKSPLSQSRLYDSIRLFIIATSFAFLRMESRPKAPSVRRSIRANVTAMNCITTPLSAMSTPAMEAATHRSMAATATTVMSGLRAGWMPFMSVPEVSRDDAM
mmetsp:Transcript_12176/g.42219  ORF Transcript_12176/g.42219 Transcript_12176/m.42219 type:complete len:297 (+) Transcript_12176:673-1563(+)